MEQETPESPEKQLPEELTVDVAWFLTEADDTVVEEQRVEELMGELYREIKTPKVDGAHAQTAPVSGESCGPSVSEAAASVMAGVEFAGKTWVEGDGGDKAEQLLTGVLLAWGPPEPKEERVSKV